MIHQPVRDNKDRSLKRSRTQAKNEVGSHTNESGDGSLLTLPTIKAVSQSMLHDSKNCVESKQNHDHQNGPAKHIQ